MTAAGLAGCGGSNNEGTETATPTESNGGSGSGQTELGERVPELTVNYWADMGGEYTPLMEAAAPVFAENLQELGVPSVQVNPQNQNANVSDAVENNRTYHITFFGHSFTGRRIDPSEFVQDYTADQAVNGGNWSQYMNCEFTDLAFQQANELDEEERRNMINRAHELFSRDVGVATISNKVLYGATSDRIELDGVGAYGLMWENMQHVHASTVNEGPNIIRNAVRPAGLEKINAVIDSNGELSSKVINSTLLYYNPQLELDGLLAESWEVADDELSVTVTLKDDIKFSNGDPITARDVAFTYNFHHAHPEVYFWVMPVPWAEEPQVEEPWGPIDVVDDKTVRFNLDRPYAPMLSIVLQHWGILHADSYIEQGALDSPQSFEPDPVITSGPWEVVDFQSRNSIRLTPTSVEHPEWNPEHDLALIGFQDAASQFEALRAGEIDIVQETAVSYYNQAQEIDGLTAIAQDTLGSQVIYPQHDFGPCKFLEFRKAMTTVMNRQRMNQLMYRGEAEIHFEGTVYVKNEHGSHPWRPPDDMLTAYTTEPEGEPEKARKFLEDEGWGWDDNGNLHYPPDADLSPVFPADGNLGDDHGFACLDSNGEYVDPEDR